MKRILMYFCMIILLQGCEKEEITDPHEPEEPRLGCDYSIVDVITSGGPLIEINYDSRTLSVQEFDNHYILEGDILIPTNYKDSNKSVGRTQRLWPDNIVYYSIDSNIKDKTRIHNAIAHWEEKTHVTFKERTNQINYVYFQYQSSGCASYIGMIGGRQAIWLSDACSTGNAIHEIGHALGLFHEQSRADRDDFIRIQWENIESGYEHNFDKANASYSDARDLTPDLDFGSIMMYSSFSFSSNGKPTLVKKDGSVFGTQRKGLSVGDIYGINQLYPDSVEPPAPEPDTDGDGIKDKDDKCPNEVGPRENNGCPWPDTDGDGVLDKDDRCYDKPGPAENWGCPWPDTDGDGILDKDDNCPNEAGPSENKGCPWPDTDGDGVLDKDDKCPTEAGPAENDGCPIPPPPTVIDTDEDGIPDKEDECPNTVGPIENKGCPWPDTDGDGVLDKDDKCPTKVGPSENQGCPWPDTDGDGVLDKDDKCPTVPGPTTNKGCPWPDTDGDGVLDKDDKCPTVQGPASNQGCPEPDTDGDGVIDKNDKCPNTPGPASNQGCPEPDTDGDGVIDREDECPYTAGLPEYYGCPEPDTDGDGIPDSIDLCPNDVGELKDDGCPPEPEEYINGNYYVIAGERVLRNNDKWYIKRGKNWKEVELVNDKWKNVPSGGNSNGNSNNGKGNGKKK